MILPRNGYQNRNLLRTLGEKNLRPTCRRIDCLRLDPGRLQQRKAREIRRGHRVGRTDQQ